MICLLGGAGRRKEFKVKDKPWPVGPWRMNPYGKGVLDNPANGRVCLTNNDPRQRGLFNAAWTLGYVAACACGGVTSVPMGAASGPLGFIHHRSADYPQPYVDSADGHVVYPAFHGIAGLTRGAGRPSRAGSPVSHGGRTRPLCPGLQISQRNR